MICRYIPKYTSSWLVTPMWLVIKFLHRAADLTLVMSHALGKEMNAAGASTGKLLLKHKIEFFY
jgi:sulfoquinovosyltransferase